ncbi:DUF1542 domain-containing protein [Holzapfeliella sp. JNUCC 72]
MYNKKELEKTQEKKILRKKKKQWIVVSFSSFFLLGSLSGVIVPGITVRAEDQHLETSAQQDNSSSNSESDSTKLTESKQDKQSTDEKPVENSSETLEIQPRSESVSMAQKGIQDALSDVKSLKDNQVTGKSINESMTQEYMDAYNLTYQGFIDGTNDGTGTDNNINDAVPSDSAIYKDAYSQGKQYFSDTQSRLIRTATQLRNAYKSSKTRFIKIMNNISLWQLPETSGFSETTYQGKKLKYSPQSEQEVTFTNTNLTIDGRNKVIDYSNYCFLNTITGDITMKDITMFGGNYFGPTRNSGSGSLTYDNITYTGPQLISATGTKVYVKNNVTVNGGQNYWPKKDTGINDSKSPDYVAAKVNYNQTLPYAGGNQENMEVSSLTFAPGSHYIGSTFNSTALYVNGGGNVEIGEGAIVELKPMGDGTWGSSSSPTAGMGYGMFIPNGNVNIRKNATLKIMPQVNTVMRDNKGGFSNLAGAFYLSSGNVNIEQNATLDVILDGPMSQSNTSSAGVYIGGTVDVSGGSFNVTGKNLGNSNNTLVNLTGRLNVKQLSSMAISAADGTGSITLLNGNGLNIDSPSNKGISFDITKMNSQTAKLFSGGSNLTSTNINVNVDGVYKPFSSITFAMNGGNATGNNMEGQNQQAFYYSTTNGSQTKYVEFVAVPTFEFNKDFNVTLDKDENYVLNGAVKTASSNANYNNANNNIYIKVLDKNNNAVFSPQYSNDENKTDKSIYNLKLKNNPAYSDGALIPFTITLPSGFDLNKLNDYKLQGKYILSDASANISLTQSQINTVISQKNRLEIDRGIQLFFSNKDNFDYDPKKDSRYVSGSNFKLGYDAAKVGYANPNSKTSDYTNGTADYQYAYNKGQESRLELESQRSAAIDAINAEATKVNSAIDSDDTLNNEQKAAQKAEVAKQVETSKQAIKDAQKAQGIKDAQNTGITAIQSKHQPQKSVSEQQTDALAQIEAQKAQTLKDIADDKTLDDAIKANQVAAVNTEAQKAEDAIKAAKNAQGIIAATMQGKAQIDSQHVQGSTLESQRSAAIDAINAEATKVNSAIDSDDTLNNEQKAAQKAEVAKQVETSKQAIKDAQNAQGIKDAQNTGSTAIQSKHQPQKSVSEQQTDALAQIEAQKAQTLKDIADDKTLDDAIKANQVAAVNTEAQKAEDAIKAAKNAQGIIAATMQGKAQIDSQHVQGSTLESQRSAAIDAINAEATKVNSAIDSDDTLNNEQKAAQKAEVAKQVETSKQAIKDAQNAQGIKDAQNTGITAIQSKHQPQKSVSEQQTDALAQIEAQKAQTLKDIADDKTLDDAIKANQVAAVNTEAQKAEDAIKAAKNAQGIIAATMQGKAQIDSQHVQGSTLESQRSAAIDAINAEATKVNSAIDSDDTLNNEQKAAQKAEVAKQVETSKQAIKAAKNAQGIKDAQNTGITAIQSKHQPQKSVSEQQTDALAQIEAQKAQTLKDIADDKTLDDATKANQVAAVNTEAQKAEDAIKAAKNAQGIIAATMQGKTQIDSQHVQGNTLESQRSAAIDAINAEATKVNSAIDSDDTLNNEQKAAQKAEVTKQVEASQQAIKDAQNAQSIKDAQNTGITAIQSKHQSQKSVSEQQTDALAQIDAQKAQTLKDIADDKTLDDATKANQVAAVNTEAKKAEDAIKAAQNAQGIIAATMQGKTQIDSQHVQGNTLESQRSAAIAAINAEATKVNSAIDTDDTLNNEQKAAQKAEVTKQVEASQQAIKDAQNAQSVKDAQNTGITAIQSKHQSKKSVSEQQTDALAQIDAQKAQTLKDIADDKTLDDATKANQVAAVNTEVKKAEDAIKAAQNAQGIIAATMQGKAQIASQHQTNSESLLDQQAKAVKAINDQEAKVLADIEKDGTLDNAEKARQSKDASDRAQEARTAINTATKAQEIADAQTQGVTVIKAAHQSGKAVSEQQTNATADIDQQVNTTVTAIRGDNSLTDAEKTTQINAAQKAGEDAKTAIEKATDAQTISNATNDGKANIIKQYQPGSLDGKKALALDSIDAAETQTLADIEKDGTLDNAEKAKQSKDASDRAQAARTAINTATKAQEIADAQTQGVTVIKAAHQSGKAVSDRKTKATGDIDQQVNTTVTAIRGDNSLTDAEKTTQINAAQKAGEDAKTAIEKATDAQTISNATNDGKANIIKQYQPGSLDGKKALALDSIDAAETQTLADIEKDGTLDNAEKAKQSKDASDRAQAARTAINTATKAQEIADAQTQGVTVIKAAHQSGKAVSDRKTKATGDIDQQVNTTVTAIRGDNSLTDAEKTTQINAAQKAGEDAKTAIEKATDAQTISNATNDGKANIIKQYQPGSLDGKKALALDSIDAAETQTLADIEKDGTLDNAEKAKQSKDASDRAQAARTAINTATKAQEIADAQTQGVTVIKAAHQSGKAVSEQQTNATADIDQQVNTTVTAIRGDNSLTDAEKTTQINAAQKAGEDAKTAIEKATDAQTISNATNDGKANIIKQYQPGSLDGKKALALDSIDAAETQTLADIEKDGTLDNAEKAKQSKDASDRAQAARTAINTATKAQEIADAQTQGVTVIKAAHQSGKAVSDRKTKATGDIDQQVNTTVTAILGDNSLTDAEKATQIEAAKKAGEDAKTAIEKATDAQTISNATNDGKANIIKQHQPGSLDGKKALALDSIDAAETQTLADIEKDGTLDNAEKAKQSKAASDRAKEARTAINTATKAQEIADAQTQGVTVIKAAHQSGKAVSEQQTKAAEDIDQQVNATVTAIRGDNSLTDAEKTTQINAAQKAGEDAKTAIEKATDAQTISNAVNDGKANIIKQYQTANLELQRTSAIKAIENQAIETLKAIDADQTLSPIEKSDQSKNVNTVAEKVKNDIKNALTSQNILDLKNLGVEDIVAQHKSNSTIYDPNPAENQLLNEKSKAIHEVKDYPNSDFYINKIKQATTFNDIRSILEESRNQSKTKEVHYVPGYGVQQWILTEKGTFTQDNGVYIPTGTTVKIFNEKIVAGIKYVQINSKDSNQWIQAQYIESGSYQAVHYVPGYGVRIWTIMDNQATPLTGSDSLIPTGETIKVLDEERVINGDTYVRIGSASENRWIQKKYLQAPVLKEVNYVKGYGVQNWMIDNQGQARAIFGSYTPSQSFITTFDTIVSDGISYTRIGSADKNIWVQTQYLN